MSKKNREADADANDAPFVHEKPAAPAQPAPPRNVAAVYFEPSWRERRWGKSRLPQRVPDDPAAYARSTGLPAGTMRPEGETPAASKDSGDKIPYPPAFRAQCEAVEGQLSAILAKGSSSTKSIWDSLQFSSRRKRNGDVCEAGVLVPATVGAFVAFNEAGGFEDAHNDGSEVWARLLQRHIGEGGDVVPGGDLPPTRDARVAFLRLEDGYGYMGNQLTPTAVSEADVAVLYRPKGYENADGLAVLFVFAWGLDVANDPKYADVYANKSGQGVLDYQWSLRGGNRGPSGERE